MTDQTIDGVKTDISDAKPDVPKRPRGFAAMDRKIVSEIAKRGGIAAHMKGTAHQFDSNEARIAGSKGGKATHRKRRAATVPVEDSK